MLAVRKPFTPSLRGLGSAAGQSGIMIPFLIFVVAVGVAQPTFISGTNLEQVFRQATIPGIIALGILFVVIAGRLDLSVGSLLSLTTSVIIDQHDKIGTIPAIACGLVVALASGVLTGFLVAYCELNSLIVTLAMLSLLQGLTMIYTGGANVDIANPGEGWFSVIGQGRIEGVPYAIVIFVVCAILAYVLLHLSTYGRYVFACGGNESTARYSGVDVKRVIFFTYVISGLSVGIAAVVLASRVSGAQNNIGAGYELTTLAAVIIGGTSLLGGAGGLLKTIVGVALLSFVTNGLIFLGLPFYSQWLVTWVVLIASVWIDVAGRRGTILA